MYRKQQYLILVFTKRIVHYQHATVNKLLPKQFFTALKCHKFAAKYNKNAHWPFFA